VSDRSGPRCRPCSRCAKSIEAETARIVWALLKEVMERRMEFRVVSQEQFLELMRRRYDPKSISLMFEAAGWRMREPECPAAAQAWAGVPVGGVH
jgi:hypothetical protein